MNPIFAHPAPTAPISLPAPPLMNTLPLSPGPSAWLQDRIARLTALAPEDAAAGLLWLAMTFPAVCDAMLDKLESDDIDEQSGLATRRASRARSAPAGDGRHRSLGDRQCQIRRTPAR